MTPADGGAAGDWIEWSGGECPVSADTRVQIKTADGDPSWQSPDGLEAGIFAEGPADEDADFDWWRAGNKSHNWRIVAYRVVQP